MSALEGEGRKRGIRRRRKTYRLIQGYIVYQFSGGDYK
jgi:hypothetical protein